MPPATNAEMQAILDAEDKNAQTTHTRNVGYIQDRYGNVGSGKQSKASASQSGDPFAQFGGKAHPNQ